MFDFFERNGVKIGVSLPVGRRRMVLRVDEGNGSAKVAEFVSDEAAMYWIKAMKKMLDGMLKKEDGE